MLTILMTLSVLSRGLSVLPISKGTQAELVRCVDEVSTPAIRRCMDHEIEMLRAVTILAARSSLKAAARRAKETSYFYERGSGQYKAIIESQRNWEVWAKRECNIEADMFDGNSGNIQYYYCMAKLYEERTGFYMWIRRAVR